MLKSLFVLWALVGVAHAEPRKYSVRATRPALVEDPDGMGYYRSCGAEGRMLRDRHTLIVDDDGNVLVDGFSWRTLTDEPDLSIDFHRQHGQKTYLQMDLYVNQRGLAGKYILWGVIPAKDDPREELVCVDAVYLDGVRR